MSQGKKIIKIMKSHPFGRDPLSYSLRFLWEMEAGEDNHDWQFFLCNFVYTDVFCPVFSIERKRSPLLRERQISHDITYMWNLKKWYKRAYLQNRNRLTDIENKHIYNKHIYICSLCCTPETNTTLLITILHFFKKRSPFLIKKKFSFS